MRVWRLCGQKNMKNVIYEYTWVRTVGGTVVDRVLMDMCYQSEYVEDCYM